MSNFTSRHPTHGKTNALVKLAGVRDKVCAILASKLKILLSITAEAVMVPTSVDQFMTVDSNLSHVNRIMRGNYDWINSDLTERKCPVIEDQYGQWEWKLFHFNRSVTSEEAILLVQEAGFEPAQSGHILTFGEINPEEQRKHPIIGLGLVIEVDLNRLVLGLWGDDGERGLGLVCFYSVWHDLYRFLGVRRRSEYCGA